jgi:hypothetical protein
MVERFVAPRRQAKLLPESRLVKRLPGKNQTAKAD